MTANRILDKLFLTSDAWWIKIIWNRWTRAITLLIIRNLPIVKGRVLFFSRAGEHYSCNPRAIAEYISGNSKFLSLFELYFGFIDPDKFPEVPKSIYKLRLTTLEYYYIFYTSQFLISNQNWWIMDGKRTKQVYIQTMHGGHGIKKFGLDAELYSTPGKLHDAMLKDTARTNLVLSDSHFFTNILRRSLLYKCPVLTEGLPRNDIFFSSKEKQNNIKRHFYDKYHLPFDSRTIIYAPTFREPKSGQIDLSVYWFNPDRIISCLTKRFGGDWYILVSCHPFMRDYYRQIYDFSNNKVIDLGFLSDVQELLLSSNALITDYSSIEMDFSLTGRPIFQLARDWREYDRGTYLDLKTLPFPFAENEQELCDNILSFDEMKYSEQLEFFNTKIIQLKESGRASEKLVDWMINKIES